MRLVLKFSILLFLARYSLTANAITFDTQNLKINGHSNYVKFVGEQPDLSDAFEKVVADFNGDGFDDILSLGGFVTCIICGTPPPPQPNFIELMLYDNDEYTHHDIGVNLLANETKIADIDGDNDIDIILSNGKLAINDGNANFTTVQFSVDDLDGKLFIADWDQDGNQDIISANAVYLNNGLLDFTKTTNTVAFNKDLLVVDLNGDVIPDVLVFDENSMQSWINDGFGQFTHLVSHDIGDNYSLINVIDANNDGALDILINYQNTTGPSFKLLINDSHGTLTESFYEFSEFNDDNYPNILVNKVFTKDADADGDLDLWVNAVFTNSNCENIQNLLVLYENIDDGLLIHKRSLHSIGYDYGNNPLSTSPSASFPTLIDLDFNGKLDVVMTGDRPVVWMQFNYDFRFVISKATTLQFNNHINAADFNNDGHMDILSSGKYDQQCKGITELNLPLLTSISQSAHGKMWLGDGKGGFEAYAAPFAGQTHLSGEYEYAKLVDLEQDGEDYLIYTTPEYEILPRRSVFQHPFFADPPLIIRFPEPTLLVEVADMNNDGQQELVMLADTETAEIIVLNRDSFSSFEELDRIAFGHRDAEIKLADMDGDGHIDIITNSKSNTASIKVFYNDGTGQFAASNAFANNAKAIAISDFNKDGKLDIYASNAEHEMWVNQGNRDFVSISYDTIFWYEAQNDNSGSYTNLIPDKITVKDIDNDGLDDLIAYINDSVHVYINNSKNNISFYKNYSSKVFDALNQNKLKQSNVTFADFNNDGLMDFASASNTFIKLNFQKVEKLSSGLYYDTEYSGHGFSVEDIGKDNLYYSLFYTYDDGGKPNWYSMLNRFEANEGYWKLNRINGSNTIHYFYDYNSSSTSIDFSLENSGWLSFYNIQGNDLIDHAFYNIGDERRQWNVDQIIADSQKPENNLSGIWWAGVNDAGWGVSLSFKQDQQSQTVVAIVYFYDEMGYPRWLIGQASGFELNQDISIEMKQINGYGRLQNQVELTELPAGVLNLNLKKASKEFGQAGHLSMDIFYPGNQFVNDNWVRNNIPIALFSKPRN